MRQAMMWLRLITVRDGIFAGFFVWLPVKSADESGFLTQFFSPRLLPRHVGGGSPFCQRTFRDAAKKPLLTEPPGEKRL